MRAKRGPPERVYRRGQRRQVRDGARCRRALCVEDVRPGGSIRGACEDDLVGQRDKRKGWHFRYMPPNGIGYSARDYSCGDPMESAFFLALKGGVAQLVYPSL